MRAFAGGLLFCALLGACAPSAPPPDPKLAAYSNAYAGEPIATLWKRQATTADSRELMMVEAELGTRGQLADASGRYLGARTAAGVGLVTYPRAAPITGPRNCADFPSAAAAQRVFLAEGGPGLDPNGLDGDGDGSACGWGAQILTVANRYQGRAGPATGALAPLPFASASPVRGGAPAPVAAPILSPAPVAPAAYVGVPGPAAPVAAQFHEAPRR